MIKGKYKSALILLSGGKGIRMGADIPKQYMNVCGMSIFEHTIRALCVNDEYIPECIIVVADREYEEYIGKTIKKVTEETVGKAKAKGRTAGIRAGYIRISAPGETRQLSILNALTDLEPYMDKDSYVMIHDAVRPNVSKELIKRCVSEMTRAVNEEKAKAGQTDGVMPYLPMKDTVYVSTDGKTIDGTVNRNTLFAGQTPELFSYHKYLKANRALTHEEMMNINGSTEPAVLSGMTIALVPGDEGNFKITTKEDLLRFKDLKEKQAIKEKTKGLK